MEMGEKVRNKNLKYYMGLDYPIQIKVISDDSGVDYEASIPELGERTFCAIGSTPTKAISNLNQLKRRLFRKFLREGKLISEPESCPDSVFSGRFVLRINTDLHKKLVDMAKRKDTSLNQYVTYLLSYGVGLDVRDDFVGAKLDKIAEQLDRFVALGTAWGDRLIEYNYMKEKHDIRFTDYFSGRPVTT